MELRVREEQACDFEGRAALDPEQLAASPLAACFHSGNLDQHLVYTGLNKGVGPRLAFLAASVHFSVRPGHVVVKAAGPMQVGEDGRVYAAVQYPSMGELWPDVYRTRAVRIAQVDVYVEVRSERETIRYPGTEFKVTYKRERVAADDLVLWRP
eukprot:g11706.t1